MSLPFIPFARPLIEEDDKQAVMNVLDSGWLTTGPQSFQFEKDFSAYVGAKHALAVNSCTAALHLALDAIGLKRGDEVITTPFTFAATAEVIRYFDAKPVFVDIDPITFNLDPQAVAAAKGRAWNPEKTKAIIPVHYAGIACEMDALMALARENGLRVIEDAAHSLPTLYKNKMVGALGDITCFSFYVTKTITTGEGGMITTDSDELAERMRLMRLHGISKDAWKRYTAEGSWYYEIMEPGFKYNLTDIAAALGIVQLKKADRMRQQRADMAQRYNEAFGEYEALVLPPQPTQEGSTHAWHLYPLRLNPKKMGISRNDFIEKLRELGIGTSVHFIPLHIHPYYMETYGYRPQDFPQAIAVYENLISLPLYPSMTEAEIQRVIQAVVTLVKAHGR